MREEYIEGHFRDQVKRRGGLAVKLTPTITGLPDRMVLMPGGRILFVELKRPDGEIRPAQEVMHSRLYDLGFPVTVLWSRAQVDAWIEQTL